MDLRNLTSDPRWQFLIAVTILVTSIFLVWYFLASAVRAGVRRGLEDYTRRHPRRSTSDRPPFDEITP